MISSRFFRLWLLWSALYLLLAVAGPNGPRLSWPHISQHLLQARAWAGSDIRFVDDAGKEEVVAVDPRLDVTPYFAHRVVEDPRENGVISNIAVRVPGPGGCLVPAQEAFDAMPGKALEGDFRCDVGFPPGPSFLLFPLVLILGSWVATGWVGPLLGGLAVASVDGLFSTLAPRIGLKPEYMAKDAVAVLAGAGSLLLLLSTAGGTFFFAQVTAVAALSLALYLAAKGRLTAASLAFGLAITSRPAMLGALGFYLALGLGGEGAPHLRKSIFRILRLCAGSAFFGGLTLILNQLRFGSPLLFGYHAMLIPPFLRQRLAEHGQFSLSYLAHNAWWVLLHPPLLLWSAEGLPRFPYLVSDPRGMGLFFVTPAFLALFAAIRISAPEGRLLRLLSWISLLLCCLPGLLYYNTGWVQWGGRFLLDGWTFLIVLSGVGLSLMPRRWVWILVFSSVLSIAWGALVMSLGIWPGCCS